MTKLHDILAMTGTSLRRLPFKRIEIGDIHIRVVTASPAIHVRILNGNVMRRVRVGVSISMSLFDFRGNVEGYVEIFRPEPKRDVF